ncbi:MAG TPA: hypothetical protein VF234_07830 [Limnochordia bacterium]
MRRGSHDRRLSLWSVALAAALFVGAALPALAAEAPQTTVKVSYDPVLGKFLTDAKGLTLYLFTRDEPGVSNCYEQCMVNWPPLVVRSGQPTAPPELQGQLGLTIRNDGFAQVTYNGWPLYYWIRDREPGQTTGQGVGDVWFVVNPAPTVQIRMDEELGPHLVDAMGMTLYLFERDEPGVSNCYDRCAQNWPPLLIAYGEPSAPPAIKGELGVITRRDGGRQVTYNGMPLYYWARDQAPGDTTGQGVGEVWYVVKP